MLLFNFILLLVFIADTIIIITMFKLFVKNRQAQSRRAQSAVRSKFRTIQEVKAFHDWRQYIKRSLIEMEIEDTIKGESKTKYLSI